MLVGGSQQGTCAEEQRKEKQGSCFPAQQKDFAAHRPRGYTTPDTYLHAPATHLTFAQSEAARARDRALLAVASSPCLHPQQHTRAGCGGAERAGDRAVPLPRGRGIPGPQYFLLLTPRSSRGGTVGRAASLAALAQVGEQTVLLSGTPRAPVV